MGKQGGMRSPVKRDILDTITGGKQKGGTNAGFFCIVMTG